MSSVAVQVMPSVTNFSKDSLIANKLASDLDAKLVSSSKKVLLQRIEFKPASKPDQQYEDLKKKYVPLNSQCTNGNQRREPLRSPDKDSNDELPPPKVVLFPKENVELNWKQIRRVGPGLNNMGNTCFLNSVLQVLTYTPPLVNYLASKEHTGKFAQTNVPKTANCSWFGCPQCNTNLKSEEVISCCGCQSRGRSVGFCMLCELQKHVVRSFAHHQGEAIKPMAIIQKLKFIAKHLRFGHQEDAHEFLRYVIDGMQRSCLAADGYTEKLDRMSKHTTMVHQVFGGYYRSQVRCLKCKNNSNTFDPLMDIMLDIKHVPTVERALQKSVKMELLDGENLYMCPRCKRKVPAHKQFLIHHAPNILTLQLKRFDYNQSFGGKITKQIEYTEYLNLRPYMTSQGAPIKYRLYAVLVHSGYSSNSGHYYCYIRASNGMWYLMNDSIVRQVTLKAVLSQQAYLLFYTKLTPTQGLKSPSSNSPKTTPLVRTPGTPKEHPPKVIQPNDLGTPVKSGIQFHRNPPSTSTVTKPLATPTTNPAPSVPLASPFQRPKFTFTISAANKGNKADLSKAKQGGNKHGERSEDIGMRPKLSSSTDENAASEIKSPIASSDKRRESVAQSESSQYPAKIDGSSVNEKSHVNFSQKEKTKTSSEESTPSKKEEKGKISSSPKKPRPPPLFIPRAVVQGKGTPQSAPRATTPWKVTPKTTTEPLFGPMSPPPPGTAPPQPSPSPAMSDTSSTSSVIGKTGEWTVIDKTILTPGPKLPERQHAGWQVSRKPESNTAEELGTPKGGGDTEVNGKESDKKKKKKKHKKEKKKKKKKKKEKSKKKYDQLSESDEEEKEEEKEKQKKKKQKNDRSEEQNRSEEKSKSKNQKRKHKGYDDDDENNANPSKKPCLVSYANSSSSSSDEHATSSREAGKSGNVDSQGSTTESRVRVIHDDEPRKKSAVRRAAWDGSRDSSTVAQLLSGSKGLHGYGSSVASWEGGENVVDSSGGKPERKRQQRDSWDEDYDRGKEKKVQKNKGIRERHFNGNPFQREHDRRSANQGVKERFSRQLSKNHHSHHGHLSKSHSSRKYRRLSS